MLGAGAWFALPSSISAALAKDAKDGLLYAAACKDQSGQNQAIVFSLDRGVITAVPLPARGHDFVLRPSKRECAVFARRPGNFAAIFDPTRRGEAHFITTRADRHFYGHGAYSSNGKLLYATENDFDNARGVIGLRDATDGYKWIAEFSTSGIDPHDLAILSDGHTLVVANGGIETHPDSGRMKLNLATMHSTLSYIDLRSGDLIEQHDLGPGLAQLSIRHLGVTAADNIIFGCQYEGPKTDRPPLVGFHRRGERLQLVSAPPKIQRAMRNYIGSVTVDRTGQIAATSAPRGGLVAYWDIASRRFLGETRLADGCGVSSTGHGEEFLLTSGFGELRLGPSGVQIPDRDVAKLLKTYAWDNHALLLEFSN